MDNLLRPAPFKRLTRVFSPRKSLTAQNAWNLYQDVFWWGLLFGIAQAFLSVYTIRLGGTDMHVGLLSALPALVATLFSIPGSRLVQRESKPLAVLLICGTLNRFGYLAVGLVPFLFITNPADIVVAIIGLLSIATAIANVAFTAMFAGAVLPQDRPHVVSTRNVLVSLSGMTVAYAGGHFLELIEFPFNYAILFALGFAASLVSIYYLSRIRLPGVQEAHSPSAASQPPGLKQFLEEMKTSRAFLQFSLSELVFHWGVFFAVPLYTIYWVRDLNAGEGWIGLYRMVESITAIIVLPLWGRFSARRGNRLVLFLSAAGMTLYTIFTPFIPSPEWIALLSALGGAASSGFSLALFNELLRVSPEQNRIMYIAVFNTLINLAAFVSPIVSTLLIPIFGIHAVLLVAAGFRCAGVFGIWRIFAQHRQTGGQVLG